MSQKKYETNADRQRAYRRRVQQRMRAYRRLYPLDKPAAEETPMNIELAPSERAEITRAKVAHIDIDAVHCSKCWGTGHLGFNFDKCPRCEGNGLSAGNES